MEKKKIGIATVYTGFNYGSSLQAFATKTLLEKMGFEAELLKLSGSIIPGRDVRIKKLATIILRSFVHSGGAKNLKNYGDSIKKPLSAESVAAFNHFTDFYIKPTEVTYKRLTKAANTEEYASFVCGSDQVWNSAVFYVDPFYYLRFAPEEKRVAFAPSFGRDFVPDYNKKKIARYVSEIKHKSVREASGIELIRQLTGEKAELLVDPTLVLSKEDWEKALKLPGKREEKYILAYFLDTPSARAVEIVEKLSKDKGLKIIGLPYKFDGISWSDNVISAGPREFLELVKNASLVCTDSFHGTAFSLNFNVPFYTFERAYGNAGKQSARIQSVLELVSKEDRYEPQDIEGCFDISFEAVNNVLEQERNKSKRYLQEILGCDATENATESFKNSVLSTDCLRSCTGCGMCEAVCPVGAVSIKENNEGFYEPVIDEKKCTDCGFCKKACYKFDEDFKFDDFDNYISYSAANKNSEELKSASSGGVSVELMREALQQGYYVAGVAYDVKSNRAVTRIAKSEGELEQFKGSKYFQSYTVDAFKEIVSDKSEQKYAIFGTPCQIYSFSKIAEIKKNREKYLLVDIFCHGCPSLKLWDKYLEHIKAENTVDVFDIIKFRSKTHGWHEYCFDFVSGKKSFSSSKSNDPFHEMFFGMDAMNGACYDCIARSSVEKTDIRIGDFWGKRYIADTKGVSAVVVASEKGKEFFDNIKNQFVLESADFNEIISEQSYKKLHRLNYNRRKETLSQLAGAESLSSIVKNRRKKLPFLSNLKRIIKNILKSLPQPLYIKIKTKVRLLCFGGSNGKVPDSVRNNAPRGFFKN